MATTGVTKNSIYGISGEWHRNGKEYCLSCVSSSNKFELTIVAYARPYSCPKKIKSEGRMKKSKCISFSPGIYEPKVPDRVDDDCDCSHDNDMMDMMNIVDAIKGIIIVMEDMKEKSNQ
ncbi:hypothetical protein RhiirA5_375098 [Rhizophagus irregularis]|uniref:Uncharacterized protein n=1 Tax=Rhizophagus irregularis TaxID=588596 RepID=A0A2I1EJH5_9GLOM|nr:hypothetical protein RhiirA5_375098 [Rhizophagus irregularis]PKY22279.1 hypothetical protein RhiirB3_502859 [Rhizophagus irregularis]